MRYFLFVPFLLVLSITCYARQSSHDLPEMIVQVRGSIVEIAVVLDNPSHQVPQPDVDIPAISRAADCPFILAKVVGTLCIVGTGFFVSDKGDVVTADHVCEAANEVVAKLAAAGIRAYSHVIVALPNSDNARFNYLGFSYSITDQDAVHDIAVFSIGLIDFTHLGERFIRGRPDLNPTAVTFDLRRPRDGEGVFASGYPLNAVALTTTSGSVATAWGNENLQTARKHGSPVETEIYRLDLKANPGNSGGPVFATKSGHVIGMAVEFLLLPGDIAIVVPSHYITELLEKNHISWSSSTPKSPSHK